MTTPSSPHSEKQDSIASPDTFAARIDRLPVATRTHRRLAWLLGFFFLFDTFDLNTLAYTAPALRSEWGLSLGQISTATSVAFAGMFAGALVGGRLSDRYGRRPVLLGAALFYSVFSLLTAAAPNFGLLVAFRLLTGFGLQAMTGVLLVFVSEMFPRHLRGRYQAMLLAIGISGVPIAAFVSRLIVPSGAGAWRWVFVIGAVGLVGVVFAAKLVPETTRWLSLHGKGERALVLVGRLEAEAVEATGKELPPPAPQAPVPAGKVRDLFTTRNLKRTIVASVTMVMLILSLYGFNAWVPTLLVERGYTQQQALTIVTILAVASVPGALLAYPFVDRVERKTLIFVLAVVAAAGVLCFGLVEQNVVMVVAGFVFSMCQQAIVAVLYTYLPEIYPTPLRGVGSGIANGFGRIAGIVGAFIVSGVFSAFGFTAVFGYLAAATLLLGIVIVAAGERTTNRPLDEIAR
ncbi:MFS transporter [Amycolatopsis acidicola]|uniref:MFS transporter n=1 Tax=Amycolatopsis acidicola TaxID=2596893 RepID=A0A5N0V4J0_9PSEU|nr:MFS transporter [Amycolatopsis acidicola]KAA9160895.1 MFS transporter [Amycolatopsis acidicola]